MFREIIGKYNLTNPYQEKENEGLKDRGRGILDVYSTPLLLSEPKYDSYLNYTLQKNLGITTKDDKNNYRPALVRMDIYDSIINEEKEIIKESGGSFEKVAGIAIKSEEELRHKIKVEVLKSDQTSGGLGFAKITGILATRKDLDNNHLISIPLIERIIKHIAPSNPTPELKLTLKDEEFTLTFKELEVREEDFKRLSIMPHAVLINGKYIPTPYVHSDLNYKYSGLDNTDGFISGCIIKADYYNKNYKTDRLTESVPYNAYFGSMLGYTKYEQLSHMIKTNTKDSFLKIGIVDGFEVFSKAFNKLLSLGIMPSDIGVDERKIREGGVNISDPTSLALNYVKSTEEGISIFNLIIYPKANLCKLIVDSHTGYGVLNIKDDKLNKPVIDISSYTDIIVSDYDGTYHDLKAEVEYQHMGDDLVDLLKDVSRIVGKSPTHVGINTRINYENKLTEHMAIYTKMTGDGNLPIFMDKYYNPYRKVYRSTEKDYLMIIMAKCILKVKVNSTLYRIVRGETFNPLLSILTSGPSDFLNEGR